MADPQNPTSYATTDVGGIGLMPLNDEFLVHVTNSSVGRVLGLSDGSMVLPPGKQYTAEWAVLLTDRPDFWDFVNLAREVRGANFTLKWMFSFLNHAPRSTQWSDEALKQFIDNRNVNVVAASIDYPRYEGLYAHGTAFQHIDLTSYRAWTDRVKRLCPGVKTLVYFHCFLDVLKGADKLYPDARVLLANGEQANYGEDYDKEFFPTLTNTFGRDIARNVDLIDQGAAPAAGGTAGAADDPAGTTTRWGTAARPAAGTGRPLGLRPAHLGGTASRRTRCDDAPRTGQTAHCPTPAALDAREPRRVRLVRVLLLPLVVPPPGGDGHLRHGGIPPAAVRHRRSVPGVWREGELLRDGGGTRAVRPFW